MAIFERKRGALARELDVAIGHVLEGQARVDRQRKLIAELTRKQHSTVQAEKFLALLEITLRHMIAHAQFVRAELEAMRTPKNISCRSKFEWPHRFGARAAVL
jgi:hypothetical protein